MTTEVFFEAVEASLREPDPVEKCASLAGIHVPEQGFEAQGRQVCGGMLTPGRPVRPTLVNPRELARRSLGKPQGRAALVHAVAHIEFNAINLALDAVWRFRGLPQTYYENWLRVARDEARHFGWLVQRLNELGHDYGDFKAHDGLWEAACNTADDPLKRMALVPRVLEARGLDVTPDMIHRLKSAGDEATARILEKILEEEVAHVTIGTRWFRFLCAERKLEPDATFKSLLMKHMHPLPKAKLNIKARERSGFSDKELAFLRTA